MSRAAGGARGIRRSTISTRTVLITFLLAILITALGAIVPTEPITSVNCPRFTTPIFVQSQRATLSTTFRSAGSGGQSDAAGDAIELGARFLASAQSGPGLTAVHLLRRDADRIYTGSPTELSAALHAGYRDLGTRFWAAADPSCGTTVQRYSRGGVSTYALTQGDDTRLRAAGWLRQGTAFRISPLAVTRWPATSGKGPLDLPPYLDTESSAWTAYRQAGNADERRLIYQIAATPTAIWLGGSNDIGSYVHRITSAAQERGEAPQFVLYAIPHRDCGSYSAGGLTTPSEYRRWVDMIREGLAGRPAVVIVEPDAIGTSCLPPSQASERLSLLRYAMQTLSEAPDVWVYLHAGSAGLNPSVIAKALVAAGIKYARGFALNVSGFDTTASETAYGKELLAALTAAGITKKHFVIDTSRNGAGRPPPGSTGSVPRWCNPPGRALGERPTSRTGNRDIDAYLWIKRPGESDGACFSGAPSSGWFSSYALGLAARGLDLGTVAELPTR